ncbi:hypothetical protein ACHAXN_001939 [Cyclotella atomus]
MLSSLVLNSLHRASHLATPILRAAATNVSSRPIAAIPNARFFSGEPFAVDAPDGDHDLQDIEESSAWAKRVIDVASITEDANSITEMHQAVFEKQMFAIDGPDGEHDLEDVEEHLAGVNRIIAAASVLEDPEQVKKAQHIQEKIRLQTLEQTFVNAKY